MNRLPEDVIRSEILKRLRVNTLAQFHSVSNEYKTLIDSPEFKNTYHVNNPNPQHRLLVRYELDNVQRYTSLVDDYTFLQPRFPLTTPESLRSLKKPLTLSSDAGLSCFLDSNTRGRVVIWSPAVRKYVDIVFPIPPTGYDRTIVGFGVCPDTSHPKLVKICVDTTSTKWLVDVFTLSKNLSENKFEGAWENVFDGPAFENLIDLECAKVSAKGVIYFRGYDMLNYKGRSNLVISFDLKSLKFDKVSLPERLAKARYLQVANVNGSLGLLEYHVKDKSGMHVCDVWTRKDGAFTNIYTVEVKGKPVYGSVLGFRNNGEVVLELDSEIAVYEPETKKIRGVGINGTQYKLCDAVNGNAIFS